jgi:hypothetical protein
MTEQTSLFSMTEVETPILKKKSGKENKSKAQRIEEKNEKALGKAKDTLNDVFPSIKNGESIHYVSMGEWSSHDLLLHLLEKTGPADVIMCTWSVSENAIRQMLKKMETGLIKSLKAVLDWRVKVRRPEALNFLKYNIADIRLTSCHAKVTVIKNEKWNIAIVTSANYTNNPRIEAGVVCCEKSVADFHSDWLLKELDNSSPFE